MGRSQWNSGKYHVNQMLRKLLEKCLNLESLSIKNDPERGYQVDLDSFLNVLKNNESLITFDISGNSMTSDNLAALKEVVLRNGVLRELHWDQNNITSKHVLGLTHALKQNKALQMVQKNFYRAVFENAATQGFQQSTTNYKRTAAKRGSFMATRPKNEVYQPQIGGNALGLPQFGGNGPNAQQGMPPMNGMNNNMNMNGPPMGMNGMPPPNPMNGVQAPPSNKRNKRPPPNPMNNHQQQQQQNKPPPNPMNNNRPPPNPKEKKGKISKFSG